MYISVVDERVCHTCVQVRKVGWAKSLTDDKG